MQKLISTIIPVYNTPIKFLRLCLNSLLAQSYAHFQIIVVDDGSNEKTRKFLDDYASKDSRILVLHQKNAGPSAARNNGIKHVKGDYLTFIDSDDILLPGAWEYSISEMERLQSDCIVYGWLENDSGKPVPRPVADKERIINSAEMIKNVASDNVACGGGYPWNKIWRISKIRDKNNGIIPLFDTTLYTYEDKEWILRVLHGLGKCVILPDVFYDYRYYPSSLSRSDNWCKRQYNAYVAYDKILDLLEFKYPEAYRGAVNFYFNFCDTDLRTQYRHPFQYEQAFFRCRKTKKCMANLCKRIKMDDLIGKRKKLKWIIYRIWGIF